MVTWYDMTPACKFAESTVYIVKMIFSILADDSMRRWASAPRAGSNVLKTSIGDTLPLQQAALAHQMIEERKQKPGKTLLVP